jgi:hypothetical protein
MTVEVLLLGLVVLVTALVAHPIGRRLLGTGCDFIDGSLGLYAIRQWLGLDTTTRRDRRIARRRAAEQAELERRIGAISVAADPAAGAGRTVPAPAAPARLVTSGEPVPTGARATAGGPALDRRQHALDALAALVVIAGLLVGATILDGRPATGDVLGATGAPAAAPSASTPPSADASIPPSSTPLP